MHTDYYGRHAKTALIVAVPESAPEPALFKIPKATDAVELVTKLSLASRI